MSLSHRSTVLCRHAPGLSNGFLSTVNSKSTERFLRIENLNLDSEPFRKFTCIPVNDSLGSAGKSNPGEISAG